MIYNKAKSKLKEYKHFLSFFSALNDGILKNPGSKFIPKGYIIEK